MPTTFFPQSPVRSSRGAFGGLLTRSCWDSAGWVVNLLSAVRHLAWAQYPAIWLFESCAILWLVVRAVRSPWVQAGVVLMLCGLMLNALVTDANAGAMPVVGMPSTLHPASPMWRAATPKTRLVFLTDQVELGLFSVGDLVMLFGGILILAICLHRTLKPRDRTASSLLSLITRSIRTPSSRSFLSRWWRPALVARSAGTVCTSMASSGFEEDTTSLARTLNEAPKAVKSIAGYHFILLQRNNLSRD